MKEEYNDYWCYEDMTDFEMSFIKQVKPYTITSPERIISLIRATEFIIDLLIPGVIVDCGMWKRGSMMLGALVLVEKNH